jgi:protein-S-isoprenylcysteine O-methyltransferase Ste14
LDKRALALAFVVHTLLLSLPFAVDPGSLSHPLVWAWLGGALALHAAERWATGGRADAPPREASDRALATATGLALLASQWAAAFEFTAGHPIDPYLATLGFGLVAVGITLRGASIRALGIDFVSEPTGRAGGRLHVEGVYAWSRHPSELGLLTFAIGSALLLGSALALSLVGLALAPLVAWRLRREDRALQARFSGYASYSAHVGWFAPRLRRARRAGRSL